MTTEELKKEIEKLATDTNVSFVQACQAMQSVADKMGNEEMITAIHKIKMQHVKSKNMTSSCDLPLSLNPAYQTVKKGTDKKIVARLMDADENYWPVVINYEILGREVNIYHVHKLEKDYWNYWSDIFDAIREEEGIKNLHFETYE